LGVKESSKITEKEIGQLNKLPSKAASKSHANASATKKK
jgi:hypothetical protein